jgi:FHA domain
VEEKTIWQRVAGLVGARGERGLRELRTHTRRCPAGHPMAVDWSDCPYCRAQRNPPEADQSEPAPAGVTSGPPGPAASMAPTLARREMPARPLGGVVVTFTWTNLGQLFPVYAGRNYAGKAATTRDGRVTEVVLAEDPILSDTHFLILYEPDTGEYRIADESGTGGTFLNGAPVDSKGAELPDEAQIRAGNTLFIFKKVRPPAPGAAGAAMPQQPVRPEPGKAPRAEAAEKRVT